MSIASNGTLTANGRTTFDWPGGNGAFSASGTFGSGTASLEWTLDGSTWVAVGTDTTVTANGGGIFTRPPGKMAVNLTGATSPSIAYEVVRTANG